MFVFGHSFEIEFCIIHVSSFAIISQRKRVCIAHFVFVCICDFILCGIKPENQQFDFASSEDSLQLGHRPYAIRVIARQPSYR